MKKLSRNDLEAIGLRIFRAYEKLPRSMTGFSRCVEPKILCEDLLGLKIDRRILSEDSSILGATAFGPATLDLPRGYRQESKFMFDGKTILVDERLGRDWNKRGRYNFTVVHEACHHALKMLYPRDYDDSLMPHRATRVHFCSAKYRRQYPVSDWFEWQTDNLTSAVLMPLPLIMELMCSTGFDGTIHDAPDDEPVIWDDYDTFACIARRLGCSVTALAIRMKQLRKINEATFKELKFRFNMEAYGKWQRQSTSEQQTRLDTQELSPSKTD